MCQRGPLFPFGFPLPTHPPPLKGLAPRRSGRAMRNRRRRLLAHCRGFAPLLDDPAPRGWPPLRTPRHFVAVVLMDNLSARGQTPKMQYSRDRHSESGNTRLDCFLYVVVGCCQAVTGWNNRKCLPASPALIRIDCQVRQVHLSFSTFLSTNAPIDKAVFSLEVSRGNQLAGSLNRQLPCHMLQLRQR